MSSLPPEMPKISAAPQMSQMSQTPPPMTMSADPAPHSSKKWIWIVIALIVLVLVAGAAYYVFMSTPATIPDTTAQVESVPAAPSDDQEAAALEAIIQADSTSDLGVELNAIDQELAQ